LQLPPPSRPDLEADGVELIEEPGQTLLLDSTVLVSGQVKRLTTFEKGPHPLRALERRLGT
jgi:7,8-dihydropterin-6-yl-methyl-4-(beta-D-ribofuranosyl)aminobenzene 5'-phosphate synthase